MLLLLNLKVVLREATNLLGKDLFIHLTIGSNEVKKIRSPVFTLRKSQHLSIIRDQRGILLF